MFIGLFAVDLVDELWQTEYVIWEETKRNKGSRMGQAKVFTKSLRSREGSGSGCGSFGRAVAFDTWDLGLNPTSSKF